MTKTILPGLPATPASRPSTSVASIAVAETDAMRRRAQENAQRARQIAEEKAERARRDRRELGWVVDQFRLDNDAAGGPMAIVDAQDRFGREWVVTVTCWRHDGVGQRKDVTIPNQRRSYDADHDEIKLRKMVSARLAGLMERQRELGAERGTARMFTASEIRLADYRIEMPLLAMLRAQLGDGRAADLLRGTVAGDGMRFRGVEPRISNELRDAGYDSVEIEVGRGVIRGAFSFGGDRGGRWSKGGLSIYDTTLPQAAMTALAGRPLGDVLSHPLFDPSMKVTAAQPTRRKGVDGIALTIKDMHTDMPAGW